MKKHLGKILMGSLYIGFWTIMFLHTGCSETIKESKRKSEIPTIEGKLNTYEMIEIGNFICIGAKSQTTGASVGIWCKSK